MKNLVAFLTHFYRCLMHVRLILAILNVCIIGLGFLFAAIEGISMGNGVYFAYITALAIGFGDISPTTSAGKVISVCLALLGIILFGILVGISTRTIMLLMHPEEHGEEPK